MKSITCWHHHIITLPALVALVALGLDPLSPVLGQTSNTTEPEVVARTSQSDPPEVVNQPPFTNPSSTTNLILTLVAVIFSVIHSAYYVVQNYRSRLRPILSWSLFDGNSKFQKQDFLGGGYNLTIQITNVGQAAALDIVSYKRIMVTNPGAIPDPPPPFHHDTLGSLYPHASMTFSAALSPDECQQIANGKLAIFEIRLTYKTINNKEYPYVLLGEYSDTYQQIRGPVNKDLRQ